MSTLVPGDPGPGGYRRLVAVPDEAPVAHTQLAGRPFGGRLRSLVAFVHLSDLHVTDAQSPARAEFLDRLGDPDHPAAPLVGRVGTYRAQESLTHQVAEAMCSAVRRAPGGPATGVPLAFAVVTGDNTDNAQANELDAYLALLDGGRVVLPDSGDPRRWEGVGSHDAYDHRYWHPDGTPTGEQDDVPRARRGFPVVRGLLDAARRPFFSGGLGLAWYAVYGNHDGLLGGTLPPAPALGALAVGARKPTAAPAKGDLVSLLEGGEQGVPLGAWGLLDGPARTVSADPRRRVVGPAAFVAAHRDGAGGHGIGAAADAKVRAYYAFDIGDLRFLVLDTVNRAGGWQGSLDADQMAWLEAQLVSGHRRFLDPDGRTVTHDGDERGFVLLSHHALDTLTNAYAPDGQRRFLAADVAALLARFPNVLCWLNGHTHEHRVRSRPAGDVLAGASGGFVEVTTASHVDWPQQGRLVEIALDEASGRLCLFTATLDHAGLVDPRLGDLGDPLTLAGWSRELSLNAWQGRATPAEPLGRGTPADRNAVIALDPPDGLARRLGGLRALPA